MIDLPLFKEELKNTSIFKCAKNISYVFKLNRKVAHVINSHESFIKLFKNAYTGKHCMFITNCHHVLNKNNIVQLLPFLRGHFGCYIPYSAEYTQNPK